MNGLLPSRRFLIGGFFVLVPLTAFAQVSVPDTVQEAGDLYDIVCTAANWLFSFVLVIAVITFLRGAVEFFGSGGNDQQVAQARKLIMWAVVGVIIAILARSLVLVVGNFLGADTGGLFEC